MRYPLTEQVRTTSSLGAKKTQRLYAAVRLSPTLSLGLGLGRRFAEVRALELPLELLHTSRGVDELLLPREERMAHVTDVHVQLRNGAPRGEAVSTCTGHLALDIFWMNLFFHNDNLPKFSSHIDQTSYYNQPSGKDKRVHLVVGA